MLAPNFPVRSRGNSRPLYRKATVAVGGVLAFAVAAAGARAGAPIHLASNQSGQICSAVIGVQPTDHHFAGCVASLNASVQDSRRDEAIARAQTDCFRQGLKPRSAGLSLCLLKADDAKSAPDTDGQSRESGTAASATAYPETAGPYTSASFDVVLHREQEACARLGIDPGTAAFVGCVSSLQDQLQRIDIPQS